MGSYQWYFHVLFMYLYVPKEKHNCSGFSGSRALGDGVLVGIPDVPGVGDLSQAPKKIRCSPTAVSSPCQCVGTSWGPVVRAGAHGEMVRGRKKRAVSWALEQRPEQVPCSRSWGSWPSLHLRGWKELKWQVINQILCFCLFEGDLCCKTFNEGSSKMKKGCTFAFS